jgi:hypothetical protein
VEWFLVPVNGTLNIKSSTFVTIEAGEGSAELPADSLWYGKGYDTTTNLKDKDTLEKVPQTAYLIGRNISDCVKGIQTAYGQLYAATVAFKNLTGAQKPNANQIVAKYSDIIAKETNLTETDEVFKWTEGKLDYETVKTIEELREDATVNGHVDDAKFIQLISANGVSAEINKVIMPNRKIILQVCNTLQEAAQNFKKAVKALNTIENINYHDFDKSKVNEDEVKKRVKDANFITGKGFKTMSDYAELSFGMDDIKKIDDAQWKNQRMAMARYAVYQYVKDNSSLDSNKTVIKSVGDCENVENWKTFVTSLKIPESCWIVTAGKKIGSMVNKYAIPFEDFIDDQIQWSHGFEGRILMSDSKNRTAYFDSSQKLTYTKNRNYFEENLKELNKALVCFV